MKKKKIITIAILVVLSIFVISNIASKLYEPKHKVLPKASLKENKIKDMFTIMIDDGTGEYKPSENAEFPKDGFILNNKKSGCIDKNGKEVKDVLQYDEETKLVSIKTKEEVYCYLYYDIAEIAGDFTFYIKENETSKYTNQKTNTGYLSWEADGITSYCISESNDVKNCSEWTNVDGVKNANKEYTFTNENNEEKTVYAYIKNNSGVTKQASDTIGYDTEAPVVDTFKIKGSNGETSGYVSSTSIKGDLTYSDNLSGVDEICIYNSNSSTSCSWTKVTSATSMNNVSGTLSSGSNRYMYAFAKDKAGNITASGKQSSNSLSVESTFYAYLYLSSYTANSITVKTSASPSSGVASYKYTVSPSVSNSCTTSTCTLSGLSAGTEYTISVSIVSNAGTTSGGSDSSSTLKVMPAKSYSTSLASLCSGKTLNACMASEYSSLNTKISDIYLNQGGMARYQGIHGEVSNNYICLGSSCSNEGDDMYRIIGITSEGQLKVIKQTQLSSTYKIWHTSISGNPQWPDSDLFHRLNDNGSGTYATTSFYYGLSSTLKSHIDDTHEWKYGTTSSSGSYNGSTIYTYTTENGFGTKKTAPIGLMYLHDYYLAYKGGNLNSASNAKNAWIYFRGNDSTPTYNYEWTMTKYNSSHAWYVYNSGNVSYYNLSYSNGVRPVFYLKSDIELTGDGTISSPFKII